MSINHVRFEGVGRDNENITVDQVEEGGEGGVKQDITYILFTEFFKLCFRRIHITCNTHAYY